MNILTVIPLSKGIPRDELSYFSARDVAIGTLVTVPFGGRKIKAVVLDQNSVRDLKTGIKGASFQLKNVAEIHTDGGLPHAVFLAAQKTARFFAQPVGAIVETMIPKSVFEFYLTNPTSNAPISHNAPTDIQLLQVPYSERISIYKTLIRENFAKRESTMIIAPTIIQAEKIFESIKTGIDDRISLFHGKITKKKLADQLIRSMNTPDPMVIVATAPFSPITRNDWNTIIVEESDSPYYRYNFGPRFDMRYFVEQFAQSIHAHRLIYADTLIGVALRARAQARQISDVRSTWHIARPEQFQIIDMRPVPESAPQTTVNVKALPAKKEFSLLDPKTELMIDEAIQRKSSAVVLASRKGLAPLTVCSDCGTTITCSYCETPLVLHRKRSGTTETRTYICHRCLAVTAPIDHCAICMGSRLTMLGISTERIYDELTARYPTATIMLAGEDDTAISKTMREWTKHPSGILIGTHGILPYLDNAAYGAIVSFDSLLSLPAYTSAETSLHTILQFLEKITDAAIIQTRNHHHDAVVAIETENLFDFTRNEIQSRTQFGYPPAKILLKISIDIKKPELQNVTDYFESLFKAYDPDILMKKSKKPDRITVQAIMKIDPAEWNNPDSNIQFITRELPRDFVREVNPDSVI